MLRKYRAGLMGAGLAVATFVALIAIVVAGLGLQCRAAGAGFGACFLNAGSDVTIASVNVAQNNRTAEGVLIQQPAKPAVMAPKTTEPPKQVAGPISDAVPAGRLGATSLAPLVPQPMGKAPPPPAAVPARTAPASDPAAVAAASEAVGPGTRQVRTVTIRPEAVQPQPQPAAPEALPPAASAFADRESAILPPLTPTEPIVPTEPAPSEEPAKLALAEPEPATPEVAPAIEQPDMVAPVPLARPDREPAKADDDEKTEDTKTAVVGRSGVNVRASPATSGKKLFALTPGQKVTVTKTDNGWLQIRDAKGRTGWIYSSFVTGA